MHLKTVIHRSNRAVQNNSPAILTALGVGGVVTTAYLAHQIGREIGSYSSNYHAMPFTTKIKRSWKKHIPVAISGVVTIGCIVGATRISARRLATVTAAASISERAFSEYREKVVEKFGANKEQQVRDDIAQDRVRSNPVGGQSIITGSGGVLCCEAYTGRYFRSDMESLRRSVNDVNARILRDGEASLWDFYYLVGLPHTDQASGLGWTSDRLLELDFSAVLTEDNQPCMTFSYNYVKVLYS